MSNFSKLFEKKNKTKDDIAIESGLDKMQGLQNLKQLIPGTDIPQIPMENIKKEAKPYGTEFAGRGAGDSRDLAAGSDVMNKVDEADRMNMMKQLEDLDQVGAFEEPDSDVNMRAAKLRALLGK